MKFTKVENGPTYLCRYKYLQQIFLVQSFWSNFEVRFCTASSHLMVSPIEMNSILISIIWGKMLTSYTVTSFIVNGNIVVGTSYEI